MAVAEDFWPMATATVAEVLGHSYVRRWNYHYFLFFFAFPNRGWDENFVPQDLFYNEILAIK